MIEVTRMASGDQPMEVIRELERAEHALVYRRVRQCWAAILQWRATWTVSMFAVIAEEPASALTS
ncbi:MAG: hypothetical protein CML03_01870 [Pseudooceanicola sp.]|nr:hypothetical protein [Pseudooceanicola sp.]